MGWTRLLLCSLIALASAESARAQSALGAPVPTDNAERRTTPLAPPTIPALASPQVIGEYRPAAATKEDIARLNADGQSFAEASAAKIKQEESQVKSRQAAVRYLATVDCRYYPEAEAGLIAALRSDRNESVRYEAALALGTCCTATRRIVDALTVAALGHVTDGQLPETSERVRSAAHASLTRVLANGYPGYSSSYAIMPATVPPTLNVMDHERRVAETVGIPTNAAPATSKSLFPWLQSLTTRRPADNVDPRLRGLNVLGANNSLAIPAANGTRRYNDD